MMWYFWLLLVFQFVQSNDESDENIGVRKNIIHLTDNEKNTILNALYSMKLSPSKYNSNYSAYDYFAVIHKLSTDPLISYGHCQASFLPWHRALLYLFEKELQFYANNTDIYLPYWDLSNQLSNNIVLTDTTFLGGNGNESAEWLLNQPNYALACDKFPISDLSLNTESTATAECLVRNFGEHRITPDNVTYGTSLPDVNAWDEILQNDKLSYDTYPYNSMFMNYSQYNTSFRAILEGCDPSWKYQKDELIPRGACFYLHGGVHVYIGGQLSSAASPLDPLFFMLHNFIDLMWAKFQDKYGDDTFPMQLMNQSLFEIEGLSDPLFNNELWRAFDVLDHRRKLHYLYDVQLPQKKETQNELQWLYIGIAVAAVVIVVITLIVVFIYCKKQKKEQKYQLLSVSLKT